MVVVNRCQGVVTLGHAVVACEDVVRMVSVAEPEHERAGKKARR